MKKSMITREQLEHYMSMFDKVKIMRNSKREGLIRTRLSGVRAARGQVIVVLDSHVEVFHNWLPPLLQPIVEDRKTVVCPMIDIIDKAGFTSISTQKSDVSLV